MASTIDEAEQRDALRPSEQKRPEQTQPRRPDEGQASRHDDDTDDQPPKRRRWPLVVLAIVVLAAAIGGGVYWYLTRNEESTDDAYTDGNSVSIAAKVSGYVTALSVNDNTVVHTGDLLLTIDPRDYETARDRARANLDLAKAQLGSAQTNLEIARVRAPASLEQAQAQLQQAQASQAQAQRDYRRQRSVDPRATTQSNIDQATAQLQTGEANVRAAQSQVQVASLVQQTIKAAEDTVHEREAQVQQAEAGLAQAEINLSYTRLTAPQDGTITRRNVDKGVFIQAGQQVFFIVTSQAWITANFKETQLARMRPGQPVDIAVDAYPDLELHGHIESIQQGSGAAFSAFPAENATGNFVKIVRRVPVKILIDRGLPEGRSLPVGLSVAPTVTVTE
ncbi:MAG: HlyD family secretion protein [Acetobacteraceae bacterium]